MCNINNLLLVEFKSINSREGFVNFFQKNACAYGNFILEKLERNAKGFFPTEPGVLKDNHHIIPKHMGGVNKALT